jgi:hypothetical protein
MLQTTRKLSDNRFYRALKELTRILQDDTLSRKSYDFLFNMTTDNVKTIQTYFNVSTLEFSNRPVINDTIFLFSFYRCSFAKFKLKLEKSINNLINSTNITSEGREIDLSSGSVILEQFSENVALDIIKGELTLASFFAEIELLNKNIIFESESTEGKDLLYLFKYDDENIFIKKEILSLFKGKEDFILDIYSGIFEEARTFKEEMASRLV